MWRGPELTVRDLGSNPPSGTNYLGDPELITIPSSRLPIQKITTSKALSSFTISIISLLVRSQVNACTDSGTYVGSSPALLVKQFPVRHGQGHANSIYHKATLLLKIGLMTPFAELFLLSYQWCSQASIIIVHGEWEDCWESNCSTAPSSSQDPIQDKHP